MGFFGKNQGINLVLMGMQLPDMSGYEVTKKLKQSNKDVIVIAQAACGMVEDKEKAKKAGCNDYILKLIIVIKN